jgi:hypothetical protein
MIRRASRHAQPGDLLLSWPILLSLLTLVVNDHLLKGVAPPPLTGILSGVAGLVLMPAVLVAGLELSGPVRIRSWRPTMMPMVAAGLAVGTAYAAVELLPAGAELYRWTWGALQWPVATVIAIAAGQPSPGIVPVLAVADPFDLLALPALALPLLAQARRTERGTDG